MTFASFSLQSGWGKPTSLFALECWPHFFSLVKTSQFIDLFCTHLGDRMYLGVFFLVPLSLLCHFQFTVAKRSKSSPEGPSHSVIWKLWNNTYQPKHHMLQSFTMNQQELSREHLKFPKTSAFATKKGLFSWGYTHTIQLLPISFPQLPLYTATGLHNCMAGGQRFWGGRHRFSKFQGPAIEQI